VRTVLSVLRTWWSPLAARAARAYVAGPCLSDALRACRRLSRQGFASTVCYWDGQGDSPRLIADEHLAVVSALEREGLNCSLSVKATPLGFTRTLFSEIVTRARQGDCLVHFDSLAPEDADETFAVVAEEIRRSPRIGCTLPGRWRRSIRDAEWAVDLGVNVRVVKGQWADPEAPDLDPRRGFLAVIDRLAGRARYVGVATHDAPLAREAFRRLRAAGTACGLELLLGLPPHPALREAGELGVPVRFYVPYGRAVLPYRLSHARHSPSVAWWIVRDLVRSHSFPAPASGRASVEEEQGQCARV
jgi:proline dehydrogenase